MERIQEFFQSSPEYFGFVLVVLGLLLIIAAIRKWKWLTEGGDGGVFNDTWIVGVFGTKNLRRFYTILGVVLILIGVAWFFLWRAMEM
jgi:uncharacterized membrane protein